jgi:parallel beta-helix repeat protein
MKKELVGIFVCVLLIGTVLTVAGSTMVDKGSFSLDGNTLYVGGSGEGNYTKIQDAIDDAVDGDTVFVFDDSSPYLENVLVNKSLNLIGEDRNTTVIDGHKNGHVVFIIADMVNLSGFTIINGVGGFIRSGVNVKANYTIISNNIIKDNYWGIGIWNNNEGHVFTLSGNIISDNKIISNSAKGISIDHSISSRIENNIISQNAQDGIIMRICHNNIIKGNEINNNKDGIDMYQDCYRNDIYFNNFTFNRRSGINILDVGNNNIYRNNFIGNLWRNVKLKYNIRDIGKNNWYENYWDKTRTSLYLIFGLLYVEFWFLGIIPWFEIDRTPATEPYDIEV